MGVRENGGDFLPSVKENSENSQGIVIRVLSMNPMWVSLPHRAQKNLRFHGCKPEEDFLNV